MIQYKYMYICIPFKCIMVIPQAQIKVNQPSQNISKLWILSPYWEMVINPLLCVKIPLAGRMIIPHSSNDIQCIFDSTITHINLGYKVVIQCYTILCIPCNIPMADLQLNQKDQPPAAANLLGSMRMSMKTCCGA